MKHFPNEMQNYLESKQAIRLVCKGCDYWDDELGECLEGINGALCTCQFAKNLIIPEFITQEELDDEADSD